MDSGCSDPVAPPSLAPHIPITEPPGSRAGQEYTVADGTSIANLGEKVLKGCDNEHQPIAMKYQMAQVTRPLNSVSEICDNDNRVVFGKSGGFIYHVPTGRVTRFQRRGKLYELDLWIPIEEAKKYEPSQHRPKSGF